MRKTKQPTFEVFTDGSQKGKWGSWAYVILRDGVLYCEASSRVKHGKSNEMEFQGAIEALKILPAKSYVTLFSDSRILIDALTIHVERARQSEWRKPNGRPIFAAKEIQTLDNLSKLHCVTWIWIKAHAGALFNERCDELCTVARKDP